MQTLLAQSWLTPATLGVMIPIIAIGGSMLIAFFHSMAEHQRKMTELLRSPNPQTDQAVQQLAAEVRQLRESLAAVNDKVNQAMLSAERNQPILGHTQEEVQS